MSRSPHTKNMLTVIINANNVIIRVIQGILLKYLSRWLTSLKCFCYKNNHDRSKISKFWQPIDYFTIKVASCLIPEVTSFRILKGQKTILWNVFAKFNAKESRKFDNIYTFTGYLHNCIGYHFRFEKSNFDQKVIKN